MRTAMLLLLLPWACSPASGGPEPRSAVAPSEPSTSDSPRPPPATANEPLPEPARDASSNEQTATPPEAPGGSAPKPGPKPVREVTYRVTQEGLVVDADGLRFTPKATPVRLANGGYSIQLEVGVEVTDDRTHTLLSPPHGPLALAAVIHDKNGKQVAHHADSRERGSAQDDLEVLAPGSTPVLKRTWPSGTVKGPLWWGQKVRLMVGLWGLGADDETPRPLNKLFVVDMVAGAKPRALVGPPKP